MGRLVGALAPVLFFAAAVSLLVSGWAGWGRNRGRSGVVERGDVSRETSSSQQKGKYQ